MLKTEELRRITCQVEEVLVVIVIILELEMVVITKEILVLTLLVLVLVLILSLEAINKAIKENEKEVTGIIIMELATLTMANHL